jgi:hypothetical protein
MCWRGFRMFFFKFSVGDKVIATGYKIGMAEFGGFGGIVHFLKNGY